MLPKMERGRQPVVLEAGSFSVQTRKALLEVRTAVGQMVEAFGVPVQSVQRSYKRLGIDQKLAWRLAKALQSEDPFAAARHVPGRAAMRGLFKRAEQEEVAKAVIERARLAVDGFDRLADAHAPSRRAFDLMLSAHAGPAIEEVDVVHRKEATAALSYTWGVVARAQLRAIVLRPGEAGLLDIASIGGFVDLQWVRPNVGWVINRKTFIDDKGRHFAPHATRPIDSRVEEGGVPLLRDYCSPSVPPTRRVQLEHGAAADELVQSDVGTSSLITCMTGELNLACSGRYRDEDNWQASAFVAARTPTEVLLVDVLLHKDVETAGGPRLLIHGDFEPGSETVPAGLRTRHRLMPWKDLEFLGAGLGSAYTPCFARYAEMLGDCLQRLGWEASEFELYRAQIEHPVIPSSVVVQYELPERGGDLKSESEI